MLTLCMYVYVRRAVPVVLLQVGVLHDDVMAREDVSGAALATAGPTAVTQTCSTPASAAEFTKKNIFFKMTFRSAKHLYLVFKSYFNNIC